MKNSKFRFVIYFIGLLAIFLVFDKIFMPWYVSSSEVVIPNVTGMHKDKAFELLESSDLEPIVVGPRYDNNNPRPKDHILTQRPRAGMNVKTGRRVYIFYSGGSPKVVMPNLIGRTYRDAELTLNQLELRIGEINQVRSENSENTIIEQQYNQGVLLDRGQSVNISISLGPKLGFFDTPDLIGLSLKEATELIKTSNLILGKIDYQESISLMANTIISQDPPEGTLVAPYDTINVKVSKGKK